MNARPVNSRPNSFRSGIRKGTLLGRNNQNRQPNTAVLNAYYQRAKDQGLKTGSLGQVLCQLQIPRKEAHDVLVRHFKEAGENPKTAHQNAVKHLEEEYDPTKQKMKS
ncbi:MAG: hypothetical protein Q7R47_06825 [Candidatus Diapherotrites archaeon]|nr:hypothetical protein [Candidatus Diapherotrites archaeon]